MVQMSDQVSVWGYIETVHYTHPARAVVMQVMLSARSDFTDPPGPYAAVATFTRAIDGGNRIDLLAAPLFGAATFTGSQLTEMHLRVMGVNCGVRAVVNQLGTAGSGADAGAATFDFKRVSFHRPENGTTAYAHTVKVYAGGRAVSDDEAIDLATANAEHFGLDPTTLVMKLTTDVTRAARTQRLDLQSNELEDLPVRAFSAGETVNALSRPMFI